MTPIDAFPALNMIECLLFRVYITYLCGMFLLQSSQDLVWNANTQTDCSDHSRTRQDRLQPQQVLSLYFYCITFLRCANISQRSLLLRRSTLPSLLTPRFSVLSRAESWRLITVWSAVVLVGDNWAFIVAMFSQCLWCSLSATYHRCS